MMKVRLFELKGLDNKNTRKEPFKITKENRHKYEVINGVYVRKDRLSTVLELDEKNNIKKITGINPNNRKIGDNIYDLNIL